jgi:hypothetical protein
MHGRKFKMQHSYIYIGKERRGTKEKWDTLFESALGKLCFIKSAQRRRLLPCLRSTF